MTSGRVSLPEGLGRLAGLPDGARVVVAMSGGVDSSLVAALLKARGYDVVAITLQLYDHGAATARPGACCAGQDIRDARRVAESLGIPHYVLDYEARFRDSVMDSFAESYLAGETPIPCVACNQSIKFSGLLDTTREIGASALVTGHYVDWQLVDGHPALYRAKDRDRDQSYFLFATGIKELEHLRFPLGGLRKSEVRDLARTFGLQVADKADSQDICFVPTGRYASVIEKLRPGAVQPGRIVHVDGRDLGEHAGIVNFTIGQRRGLGIASGEPLYVVRLDADRREVVVGRRDHLLVRTIALRNVNWLGDGTITSVAGAGGYSIDVRLRSSQAPRPGDLIIEAGAPLVRLRDGEHGVAPGQACVFYRDDATGSRMLGGGWIAATFSADQVQHRVIDRAEVGAKPAGVTG